MTRPRAGDVRRRLSGEHPEITWLTGTKLAWTMHNDWLNRDVPDSVHSFLP